jgi:hypothetical protein
MKDRRVMQDTTPAANHRRADHDDHVATWVDATWFEYTGEEPRDAPLIALIPMPRDPNQGSS